MEGSDGGRASWSYREQTESSSHTISSSAGTLSTGFTSAGTLSTGFTSTASRLSWTSMEAARHWEEMEKEDPDDFVQPVKKLSSKMEHMKSAPATSHQPASSTFLSQKISTSHQPESAPASRTGWKSLVKEFFDAKSSIGGGDMSVLERWFTELGVGWIFHLPVADGAPEAKLEHTLDASRWMLALTEIMDTFRFTTSRYSADKEEPAMESEKLVITELFQFASFTQQAMLRMLCFIDVIVARNHNVIYDGYFALGEPYRKLHILLRVRDTLSKAKVRLSSYQPASAEVGRIRGEMISVLSVKKSKAGEAIWSAMEENRNRILESVDNSSGTQTPQVSSDIHEATESLMEYVLFLHRNSSFVDPIVRKAASLCKYLPQIRNVPPLSSLLVEMMSCVQEKLANMSEKFPDQSLGFLFLINNLSFIWDQLLIFTASYSTDSTYMESLMAKVDGYMKSYIQESWAPVLSCLFNPKPLWFGKSYSPLAKFETKFRKTYVTQKLWKVPDPKLRKTLREAITKIIVPVYTKYIEDNSVATPKFTPQNLQEMLQELFEG